MTGSLLRPCAAPTLMVAGLAGAVPSGAPTEQRPAFREAVDLIEVTVRVVGSTGEPIPGLAPNAFEVAIQGKKRRVVSADYVRHDAERAPAPPAEPPLNAGPPSIWPPIRTVASTPQSGRIYVLYFDRDTFDVPDSRGILTTAASFVERLQPSDQIGLFAFPLGAQMDPTTDHAAILTRLGMLTGGLSAGSGSGLGIPLQRLYHIRTLLQGMAGLSGQKTLVIMSGSLLTTVQAARPDVSVIDKIVGQLAQRSDTAIYALFVDSQPRSGYSRSLDRFVGTARGTALTVFSGRGEAAFDQILRETSAYYVLGVEPAEADRDGQARQLSVKVSQRGAVVHGSRWVTVPRRK